VIPDLAPLLGAASPADWGVLFTGFLLGLRHGIDWDHIAAISDITSTTAGTVAAEAAHQQQHQVAVGHEHAHGGQAESQVHGPAAEEAELVSPPTGTVWAFERQPIFLGTLYALGHAFVVAVLGLAVLLLGARLPDWIDPIMSRVVGATLVFLGVYVLVSLYQYARHGGDFRLRSRWLLVFDGFRGSWRRIQARIHGHTHVDPVEASSYGPRTAFGVGMIHGIGAETASQVLLIAAVGGAASAGLGVPMLFAFIIGLVISNTAIVVLTATGFLASQYRTRIYLAVGLLTAIFSLWVGLVFLFGADALLPTLSRGLTSPLG
jgi:high-affinity nickel-transport protein